MDTSLEQLWNDLSAQLRHFIRVRVRDHAAAEDILQDVFVKIQKKSEQLATVSNVPGWIFLIARNAVIDHYRTRKETTEVPEDIAADEENPESTEQEGLKAAFRRMIHSLPEPYREAVLLTEFEGLTQKQLAERLGISVSGAKSRVQRGREQLKEKLLACCRFEFDRRGKVIDCTAKAPESCPECGSVTDCPPERGGGEGGSPGFAG